MTHLQSKPASVAYSRQQHNPVCGEEQLAPPGAQACQVSPLAGQEPELLGKASAPRLIQNYDAAVS